MGEEKKTADYHYDAFISYRHAPLDIEIAEEIQNRLEHFHVPGSIRRKTGKKRIARLFRDKAELPITSDLNDDIFEALKDADYLIVICSTSTHESLWVQREIETFLKYHDRKHVLTVIASGEPGDVVPKILCEETVETVTEEGETVSVKMPLEPLSCDYRMDRRRARREEIPRLAAAILGCHYDELRQRQREYRNRILGAAMAAAGMLLVYFVWSNIRIRENYRMSLENQSRYLAQQSLLQMDASNQLLAVQLALAALPSETADRPVVPEARYALQQALKAYDNPALTNIGTTGRYVMDSSVSEFLLSEDCMRFATLDSDRYDLWIWDAASGEVISRYSDGKYISRMILCGGDRLVLISGARIVCLSIQTGEELWSQKAESVQTAFACPENGTDRLALVYYNEMTLVSAENGDILGRIPLELPEDQSLKSESYLDHFQHMVPDGSKSVLACTYSSEPEDGIHEAFDISGFLVADHDELTAVYIPFDGCIYELSGMIPTNTGTILVSGLDRANYIETMSNGIYMVDGSSAPLTGYSRGEYTVTAVSAEDGSEIWTYRIPFSGSMQYGSGGICLEKNKGSRKRDVLAASVADAAVLLDPETGKELYFYSLESPLMGTCDLGEEFVYGFMNNGEMLLLGVDEYDCVNVQVAADDVREVRYFRDANGRPVYLICCGGVLYRYDAFQGDRSWTACGSGSYDSGDSRTILDDYIICWDYDEYVKGISLDSGEVLWGKQLGDKADTAPDGSSIYHDIKFIGAAEDQSAVYFADYGWMGLDDYTCSRGYITDPVLYRIETASGRTETVDIPSVIPTSTASVYLKKYMCMAAGRISYMVDVRRYDTGEKETSLFCADPETGDFVRIRIPEGEDSPITQFCVSPDGKHALVFGKADVAMNGWICDLETGNVSLLEAPAEEKTDETGSSYAAPACTWSEDGTFVAVNWEQERLVRVFDLSGRLLRDVTGFPGTVKTLFEHGGELLLMTEADVRQLNRYSAKTGAFLGRTKLDDTVSLYNGQWASQDSGIFYFGGSRLCVFDTEKYAVVCMVRNCIGYNAKRNRIYTSGEYDENGKQETRLGWYDYYSVEELVKKGEEYVGTAVLSEEQKSVYGIE